MVFVKQGFFKGLGSAFEDGEKVYFLLVLLEIIFLFEVVDLVDIKIFLKLLFIEKLTDEFFIRCIVMISESIVVMDDVLFMNDNRILNFSRYIFCTFFSVFHYIVFGHIFVLNFRYSLHNINFFLFLLFMVLFLHQNDIFLLLSFFLVAFRKGFLSYLKKSFLLLILCAHYFLACPYNSKVFVRAEVLSWLR